MCYFFELNEYLINRLVRFLYDLCLGFSFIGMLLVIGLGSLIGIICLKCLYYIFKVGGKNKAFIRMLINMIEIFIGRY